MYRVKLIPILIITFDLKTGLPLQILVWVSRISFSITVNSNCTINNCDGDNFYRHVNLRSWFRIDY